MARYRNTGAPIPREDGSEVPTGEVFEPTDAERRKLAYKLEPVGDPGPQPETDPLAGVAFGSPEAREKAEERIEAGALTLEDLEGRLGTGQGHAFRVSDIDKMAGD